MHFAGPEAPDYLLIEAATKNAPLDNPRGRLSVSVVKSLNAKRFQDFGLWN